MNPLVPILLYAAAYALLFVTWAAVVFLKVPGADSLVQYIQITLGGLTGHVLTLIDPRRTATSSPPHVAKQAGFASLAMLAALAVVALLLSGCASFQQALVGYESAAASGMRSADDNVIAVWSTTACATPVSAALRNPQIIPALKALCMPGGETAPISLLDAMQTQRQLVK